MRKTIFIVVLSACFAPVLLADVTRARAVFERSCGAAFSYAELRDQGVAPDDCRYDRAPGRVKFVFAMPYAEDSRLKFVTAEFDGGKFVSGRLHVFGLKPRPIDETAFGRLRDEQPMACVRADSEGVGSVAAFYAPRGCRAPYVTNDDQCLQLDPVSRQLGWLGTSLGRLDVDMGKLAYRVVLKTKDGIEVDLGVATAKSPVAANTVIDRVRFAIEKRDGSRKGMVSDRDVVDCRHDAEVVLKAAKAGDL